MTGCIQPKSQVRIDTEEWLSKATVDRPITAKEIADHTGHPVMLVRAHISNSVARGQTYNLRQGERGAVGLYVGGQVPKKPVLNMPAPRTAVEFVPLKLKPWNPPRAESLAFLNIPSLHCGQQIERKRPAIIAGRALEPAVMRGGVS